MAAQGSSNATNSPQIAISIFHTKCKGMTIHYTAYFYLRPRSNFDHHFDQKVLLQHYVAFMIVDFTTETDLLDF